MSPSFLISVFAFLFGLCIGSFLNCVIYRLEQKKNLKGRSFCPHCKHILSWNDLFPVFSFLFLKGKCRYCKKPISAQYPLVELATGLIFVLILNQFQILNIVNLIFLFYISSALIIIFVYDLKHYLIPDKILLPAVIIALIYNLVPPYNWQHINYNFLAALIASGFFLIIFLISKGKWMGFGDVKLAVLMGLLLSIPNIFVALFLAFFFGAIIGVILMVFEKKSLKSEIPFGPFLITGTFVAMLYANQIIQWYLNLFKI
jgi:prepilin signal peptidase PulO-like enzyme (type II secretory pathway)